MEEGETVWSNVQLAATKHDDLKQAETSVNNLKQARTRYNKVEQLEKSGTSGNSLGQVGRG